MSEEKIQFIDVPLYNAEDGVPVYNIDKERAVRRITRRLRRLRPSILADLERELQRHERPFWLESGPF